MGHYEWIIGKGIDKWVSLKPADYKSSCPSQYGRASKFFRMVKLGQLDRLL